MFAPYCVLGMGSTTFWNLVGMFLHIHAVHPPPPLVSQSFNMRMEGLFSETAAGSSIAEATDVRRRRQREGRSEQRVWSGGWSKLVPPFLSDCQTVPSLPLRCGSCHAAACSQFHYCRARPTLLIRGRSTSFMRWTTNPMIMKVLKSMMQGVAYCFEFPA